MGCRLVRAQILKHRAQAVAAADFLSGDRVSTVHVDEELSVRGEERHLAHDVPAVCAMSISIDKFAYGKAISSFSRGEITMTRSLHCKGHRLLLRSVLTGSICGPRPWSPFAVSGQALACRREACRG